MRKLVEEDISIKKYKMPIDEALTMFKKAGMEDKVRVLKYRKSQFLNVYEMGGMKDYFYGYGAINRLFKMVQVKILFAWNYTPTS